MQIHNSDNIAGQGTCLERAEMKVVSSQEFGKNTDSFYLIAHLLIYIFLFDNVVHLDIMQFKRIFFTSNIRFTYYTCAPFSNF